MNQEIFLKRLITKYYIVFILSKARFAKCNVSAGQSFSNWWHQVIKDWKLKKGAQERFKFFHYLGGLGDSDTSK
jgi:hypothetical protein